MANNCRAEINNSVTDSLYSVHRVGYMILNFYGRIRIPRIAKKFGTCADSVHQALFSPMKESLDLRLATAICQARSRTN